MSAGAYALLRFADTEKLLPAIELLRSHPSVERWHAVDGHYHLILAVSSPDRSLEEAIASLESLEFHQLCPVTDVVLEAAIDPANTAAYVLIEIASESKAAVTEKLQSKDIGFSALAHTDCGAIGVLQRERFEDVDHIVNETLRSLDGVLRVKRDWIIDLTQL